MSVNVAATYGKTAGMTRRDLVKGAAAFGAVAAIGGLEVSRVSQAMADEAEGELDEVQELYLENTDLSTLDVNDFRNANEAIVLSHVHEGLFRTFNTDGADDVQPAGCESYDVSDDGLVYTFYLRDNYWSDGEPVIAQHYVDSIVRLCNPDNGFSYAFMADDIVGCNDYSSGTGSADDIGAVAVDEKTLELTLRAPMPSFIDKLISVCFAPIRLDLIEEYGDTMSNDYTLQVYSGPFVISSRILDNSITLAPNEYYWDAENVHLQKVTLTEISEDATKSQMLQSGQLDAVSGTTEYVSVWSSLADAGQFTYRQVDKASVNYVIFNQHTGGLSGLMNNAKVRLAISLCLNREEYVNTVQAGLYTVAYGLIPPGITVGDDEYRAVVDEPLLALLDQYSTQEDVIQLFTEGVQEVTGSDDLSGINLTILGQTTSTLARTQLEWLSQSIGNYFGIEMTINAQGDSAMFVEERNNNNYDLGFQGWNGDYNDPLTFMELWNTGSGYARYMGGYSDETFDADYEALATEGDNSVRLALYQEMEQNLIENAGMSPLYYGQNHMFIQSWVKNLSTPMFGSAWDFSRAYISGR